MKEGKNLIILTFLILVSLLMIFPCKIYAQNQSGYYKVYRVVDGDTIQVWINNKKETIRLIGIDSPEAVDPRKPVQCFAREASKKAKEVLLGKLIKLEADKSQGERDKYKRLLRYVFLANGTNFDKFMIDEGYAHEYTYNNNPYKYQSEFKLAEIKARVKKKGLWADNACAILPTSAPTKTIINLPPTEPIQHDNSNSNPPVYNAPAVQGTFACNCSKTCPQMSSCAEAQYQLNVCGCGRRDADKDGIACDADCQ